MSNENISCMTPQVEIRQGHAGGGRRLANVKRCSARGLASGLLAAGMVLTALGGAGIDAPAQAQVGDMSSAEKVENAPLLLPLSHRRAPLDFTLPDVNSGKNLRLADLRGKVVVVNFWSTACPACRAEMPTLQKLRDRLRGMDVEVLSVHIGGDADKVRAFLKDNGINMAVLQDVGGNVAKAWGALHLPVTYVLAQDGSIAFVAYGARNWNNPQITRLITTLIPPLQGSE